MRNKFVSIWPIGLLGALSMAHANTFVLPNDIEFTGSVIDPVPNWGWRTKAEASHWATGWETRKNEGVTENGTTRFTYPEKNGSGPQQFIEGRSSSPASSGQPELLPVVKIKDNRGGWVTLNGNTLPQTVTVQAYGQHSNGGDVLGLLSFNIESAYSVTYKISGNDDTYFNESYDGVVGGAAGRLLRDHEPANYAINPKGGAMSRDELRKPSGYSIASVIRGDSMVPSAYGVLASFSSQLSNINTVWTSVPDTWSASIKAQVEIQ